MFLGLTFTSIDNYLSSEGDSDFSVDLDSNDRLNTVIWESDKPCPFETHSSDSVETRVLYQRVFHTGYLLPGPNLTTDTEFFLFSAKHAQEFAQAYMWHMMKYTGRTVIVTPEIVELYRGILNFFDYFYSMERVLSNFFLHNISVEAVRLLLTKKEYLKSVKYISYYVSDTNTNIEEIHNLFKDIRNMYFTEV